MISKAKGEKVKNQGKPDTTIKTRLGKNKSKIFITESGEINQKSWDNLLINYERALNNLLKTLQGFLENS